jgi:hypothetical protein
MCFALVIKGTKTVVLLLHFFGKNNFVYNAEDNIFFFSKAGSLSENIQRRLFGLWTKD